MNISTVEWEKMQVRKLLNRNRLVFFILGIVIYHLINIYI